MPVIFEPDKLPRVEKDGAKVITLANREMLGTNALHVERILLRPGAMSGSYPSTDSERFIYVVRGQGKAHVQERVVALERESVLWLEMEDTFFLQAEQEELEVLLCSAPASS